MAATRPARGGGRDDPSSVSVLVEEPYHTPVE